MRIRHFPHFTAILLAAAVGGTSLAAGPWSLPDDSLVLNGDFAGDLADWHSYYDHQIATWIAEDANGDPASGSVRLRGDIVGNGGASWIIEQCLELPPITPVWWLGAKARVLNHGETGVAAVLSLGEYAASGCAGPRIASSMIFVTEDESAWREISEPWVPLASDTTSLTLSLAIRKETGVSADAEVDFDDVWFSPGDFIFFDGFDPP